jgi:hypothetical protein
VPPLPAGQAVLRMRYGHFGCNVVHEDIAFAPAVDDPHAAKMQLKCEKMRYFALRSNFITPLPLLLLHPARLTIASHNIFLRTLKRGWGGGHG